MNGLAGRWIAPAVAVFLLLIYWPIAALIDNDTQAELLRAAQGTIMFLVFTAFAVKLRHAYAPDVPDSARRFFLGLILWSLGAAYGADWRLAWRLLGGGPELDWMLHSDAALFQIWVEIVGIFFMLSGPPIVSRKHGDPKLATVEDISWSRLAFAAFLCVSVSYTVVIERVGIHHLHKIVGQIHSITG